MRSRLKTIGKEDFPSSNKNSYVRITNSRDGIKTAVPTREKLQELDLGYVADDLEKRGILKNGQD